MELQTDSLFILLGVCWGCHMALLTFEFARRRCSAAGSGASLLSALNERRQFIQRFLRFHDVVDPSLQKIIEEKVMQKRVDFSRKSLDLAVGVFFIIALVTLLGQAPQGERRTPRIAYAIEIVIYASLLLLRVQPRLLNKRTLKYCYIFMMVGLLLLSSPLGINTRQEGLAVDERQDLFIFFSTCQTALLSIMIAFINLDHRWYLPCNCVVALMQSYTVLNHAFDGLGEVIGVRFFLQAQCITFAETSLILLVLEYGLVSDVLQQVNLQKQENQQSALKSMLNIMCEAVVELDPNWVLVDEAPRLAQMLLAGAQEMRSLEGENMLDLLPEPVDQQEFEQQLRGAPQNEAKVFHGRVSDATGYSIQIEFFHVAFASATQETHHLLGLREHADFRGRCSSYADAAAQRSNCSFRSGQPAGAVDAQLAGNVVLGATLPIGNGGEEAAEEEEGEDTVSLGTHEEEMQVDFVASLDYPIACMSLGFAASYGHGPSGTPLADWLPRGAGFFEWLTLMVDLIYAGEAKAPLIKGFGYCFVAARRERVQLYSRPGPRLLTVLFPDPQVERAGTVERVPRNDYKVSLRIGPRQREGQTLPVSSDRVDQEIPFDNAAVTRTVPIVSV